MDQSQNVCMHQIFKALVYKLNLSDRRNVLLQVWICNDWSINIRQLMYFSFRFFLAFPVFINGFRCNIYKVIYSVVRCCLIYQREYLLIYHNYILGFLIHLVNIHSVIPWPLISALRTPTGPLPTLANKRRYLSYK